MKKTLAALAIGTLALSSAAMAQTAPPPAPAQGVPPALQGGEITPAQAAGVMGAFLLTIAIADDDDPATATTTTTFP